MFTGKCNKLTFREKKIIIKHTFHYLMDISL